MERRTFFKNLFGIAIITALPIPVMDAIIELDKKEPIKINADRLLYLYDINNEMIGCSNNFELSLHLPTIEVTTRKSGSPEYIKGLPSWSINTRNITLFKPAMELIQNANYYRMIMFDKTITAKYMGNVYITDIYQSSIILDHTSYDLIIKGTGNLIVILKRG